MMGGPQSPGDEYECDRKVTCLWQSGETETEADVTEWDKKRLTAATQGF